MHLQDNHAVLGIIELVKKYKKEIIICAIGPLTNLALAVKIMPELPSLLKEVIIIGGNYSAVGNTSAAGEFNFLSDPAAAHVVLEEYCCPVTVIPWETLEKNMVIPTTTLIQKEGYGNPRARLLGIISEALMKSGTFSGQLELAVDPIAVAVALNKKVITESVEVYCVVEVTGEHTKGMMVVDWNKIMGKHPNVTIVKEVDNNIILDMIAYCVQ